MPRDLALEREARRPPAGRLNIREVAAVAGVSISAVSLAINGKPGVSADKRARVLRVVQELGYKRNGRVTQGTAVLGLLMETLSIPAAHDRFYAEIVAGIERAAQRMGYRLLLHLYRPGVDPIGDIRELMGRDIDGLIIANGGDITDEVIGRIARGKRTPLVLVENYVSQPVHAVLADNFCAGLEMTRHLLSLGHTRIGALPGPAKYKSLVDRLRGYTIALLEHGLTPDPQLQPPPTAGHPRKGYVQMQQLLSLPERPTAVFAVSDKTAFGAMEAIKDAGLRIPDDVSIVGIDDVHESAYTSPPLTTYHVPKHALGEVAVATLDSLLKQDTPPVAAKIALGGELVVRESCTSP